MWLIPLIPALKSGGRWISTSQGQPGPFGEASRRKRRKKGKRKNKKLYCYKVLCRVTVQLLLAKSPHNLMGQRPCFLHFFQNSKERQGRFTGNFSKVLRNPTMLWRCTHNPIIFLPIRLSSNPQHVASPRGSFYAFCVVSLLTQWPVSFQTIQ